MRTDDLGEAVGFFYTLSGVLMGAAAAFVATHLLATNVLAMRSSGCPRGTRGSAWSPAW